MALEKPKFVAEVKWPVACKFICNFVCILSKKQERSYLRERSPQLSALVFEGMNIYNKMMIKKSEEKQ